MTRLFIRQYKSVGFVDAGACEGADIILAKRREDASDFAGALENLTKVGRRMAGARLAKFREVVSQLSALLADVDDESPDEGSGKDTSMSKKFDPAALPEDAREYIAGVEKAAAERAAELDAKVADLEAQVAAKKADPEDAFKALPEEVRKRIEDAEKSADEARKAAAAERDARVTAEFVQKAAFAEGKLPITAAKLGPILKRASEGATTAEDAAEIERVLKAAAEASRVTAIIGDDGRTEASAIEKIEAEAAEIRKNNPLLSLAAARVEARKRNPELAKAEQAERRTA